MSRGSATATHLLRWTPTVKTALRRSATELGGALATAGDRWYASGNPVGSIGGDLGFRAISESISE